MGLLKAIVLAYELLLLNFVIMTSSEQMMTCPYISKSIESSCKMEPNLNLYYEEQPTHIIRKTNATGADKCKHKAICLKTFKISRLEYHTFSDIMHEIIANMVARCCDGCANLVVERHLNDIVTDYLESENSSDFIYPVFGEKSLTDKFDHRFVPILDIQSGYYFTARPNSSKVAKSLIAACLGMWPLIIICILMAFISGFLIWFIEKKKNKEDFPSNFRVGVFQGFWWSFVSMTTVGYGDKAPKTFLGRIYAVLWILFGITFCSIFTANFSTDMASARTISHAEMRGKTVGVLKNRLEDVMMVIHNGGKPYEQAYNKTDDGISELIDMLLRKELSGFLLNRDTYQYFSKHIRKKHPDIVVKMRDNLMRTRMDFRSNEFAYGLLVKNSIDHTFFSKYIRNNRLAIDSCYAAKSNDGDLELELLSAFVSDREIFNSLLYYCIGSLGLIALIGIAYETQAYYKNKKGNSNGDILLARLGK